MTAQSLQPAPRIGINSATVGLIMAVALQFAGLVAWGARVEARQAEQQTVTEPLRRGDLVKIQTDVSWIRERLAREDRQ